MDGHTGAWWWSKNAEDEDKRIIHVCYICNRYMLNFSKLGKEDASLCKWHLPNNEHALKATGYYLNLAHSHRTEYRNPKIVCVEIIGSSQIISYT